MRRTRTSILVSLLMVAAACGGGEDDTGASGSEPSTGGSAAEESAGTEGAETESGETEGGESTAAAGDCTLDEPVRVGAVFSQTGGAAVYGETQIAGAQLAVDELNEQGGVTYELVIEDDASEPQQGIPVFEQLVNDDVAVILGPTLSNTAFSAMPIAQDAGIPVLGVSTTATGITDIGEFVFRASLTEQQAIPQAVEAAVAEFGLEQVAALYGDDDAFTQSGYEVFEQALEEQGVEITTTQTFATGDTDFSAQLTEAANTEPDALVISALAEEAAPILEQARDLGIEVPVVGGNGFNSPAMIENAGEAAEGVIVGAAWNSAADTPANGDFIEAYTEAAGSAPDQFAAQAYTGVQLVDAAVRAGCSAEPEAIQEGFAAISGQPTVLGEFSFTDTRDADHPAVVQIVEGGEFEVLDPSGG